jgi:hypothetical protein
VVSWGYRPSPGGTWGLPPASPAGVGRCTRSPRAYTSQGAAAGADRRLAGVGGPGVAASPRPHGACGTMAGPPRPPPPEPERTRGVPLLGRASGVRPPSTMAHRTQPDGRAPAPAPTPGKSGSLVVQMHMHHDQRLSAECRLHRFQLCLLVLKWCRPGRPIGHRKATSGGGFTAGPPATELSYDHERPR